MVLKHNEKKNIEQKYLYGHVNSLSKTYYIYCAPYFYFIFSVDTSSGLRNTSSAMKNNVNMNKMNLNNMNMKRKNYLVLCQLWPLLCHKSSSTSSMVRFPNLVLTHFYFFYSILCQTSITPGYMSKYFLILLSCKSRIVISYMFLLKKKHT